MDSRGALTGELLRPTEQSWAWDPVSFTVANTTRTLEKSAEKLSSTTAPQGKLTKRWAGKSEEDETTARPSEVNNEV